MDERVIWLVVAAIVVYLIHVIVQNRLKWMSLPPGPWGLPIIGSYKLFS